MWYLKSFYEGLRGLHKTFWGNTKKCDYFNVIFRNARDRNGYHCIWSLLGYQDHCSIVPKGPASSIMSFNIYQGLKCSNVASIQTLTMQLPCYNCVVHLNLFSWQQVITTTNDWILMGKTNFPLLEFFQGKHGSSWVFAPPGPTPRFCPGLWGSQHPYISSRVGYTYNIFEGLCSLIFFPNQFHKLIQTLFNVFIFLEVSSKCNLSKQYRNPIQS